MAKKLDIFVLVYLDKILIYNKDSSQLHNKTVKFIIDQFHKYFFFANQKNYYFH